MKKVFLVDISSFIFRAFYAIRQLTSPTGMPTNAIYGVLSMVVKILKDEKPEYMAFCYDRPEPSFRKELDPNYKANRSEMPEDLIPQIPYIKDLVRTLGIPAFEVPQYEADDLIGTIACKAIKNGFQAVIVSGDKDFGQLISPHVTMWDTMKDFKYDPKEVKEKWGVPPEHFIDYLALVGDSSDNIKGVSGIGPKGAVKLLSEYQTLEGIYENLDKIAKGMSQKLTADKDNAFLARKLVTINQQVPFDFTMEDLRLRQVEREKLQSLLRELNFKTLEKSLLGEVAPEPVIEIESSPFAEPFGSPSRDDSSISVSVAGSPAAPAVHPVLGQGQVHDLFATISHSPMTVAQESVEEDVNIEDLAKWVNPTEPLWLVSNERFIAFSQDKKIAIIKGEFAKLGECEVLRKVPWKGFGLKSFWRQAGIQTPTASWDSELAAYCLRPSPILDFQTAYKNVFQKNLPTLASASQLLFANQELEGHLRTELKEKKMERYYFEIELPLTSILLSMEQAGFLIDTQMLQELSKKFAKEIQVLETEICEMAGEKFNIASPRQLGHVLFEKLGLPAGKKTKTGFSTDTDVLEKLKAQHPIAEKVIEFREISKLKSTYVDALPALVNPQTGRVHTTFQQAMTATGRLSSIQPNLQNIPIRTQRGSQIRQAFVASPGQFLLSVDYSQIELRILAHFSEDPGLIRAFSEDLDIHAATAAEVFDVPVTAVTPDLRRTAKAINFGIAYGQGAFGLAEALGIPRGEATDIIKRYFERFTGVRAYMDSTVTKAMEQGFVETLSGRRRYLDELKSKNQMVRKFGERAAINAPIQGTASDIVKIAMIRIADQTKAKMILQVHDELIFEGTQQSLEADVGTIKQIMENAFTLRVPLKVNYMIAKDWEEAH